MANVKYETAADWLHDLGDVPLERIIMDPCMRSGRVRLPDVTFVSVKDLPGGKLPVDPIPSIPPALVVETLSATNTKEEIRQKLREYFESGAVLAWIIDPETRTVAVYETFAEQPTRVLQQNDESTAAPSCRDLHSKSPASSTAFRAEL
jgi:Uma2 family endonuclease